MTPNHQNQVMHHMHEIIIYKGHLYIPTHRDARIYFPIVAKVFSSSRSLWFAYEISIFVPSISCNKMASKPLSEASVCK